MKRLEINDEHGNMLVPRQICYASFHFPCSLRTFEGIVECLIPIIDKREDRRIIAPVGIYPADYPRLLDSLVAGELTGPSVKLTRSKINRSHPKATCSISAWLSLDARIRKRRSKLSYLSASVVDLISHVRDEETKSDMHERFSRSLKSRSSR